MKDEAGGVVYKKQEGTAFVTDFLSDTTVMLESAAHNFFFFKESSHGTIMIEPIECIYLYQLLPSGYHLKFHVLEFYPMASYKTHQTITDGSDLCLALASVDTNDPSYSPLKMQMLKLIEMAELPFAPEEKFTGRRSGYPFNIYDP